MKRKREMPKKVPKEKCLKKIECTLNIPSKNINMERTRKVQQQVNELFAPKFWELIENNKSKLLDWFLLSSNPNIT